MISITLLTRAGKASAALRGPLPPLPLPAHSLRLADKFALFCSLGIFIVPTHEQALVSLHNNTRARHVGRLMLFRLCLVGGRLASPVAGLSAAARRSTGLEAPRSGYQLSLSC